MKAHWGTRVEGRCGTATELVVDEHDRVDTTATVAAWVLDCPRQSPAWRYYTLAVIHLRPIEGESRPANIRIPHATHEVLLIALANEEPPEPDANTWQHLRPINLMEQVQLPDDEAAVELCRLVVEAVLAGTLWAEPPLSGQVEPWRTVLVKTSAHLRGEEHAP